MQPRFIDLHTHTTASDGSDTPVKLVERAAALKLAAVAVTDHDTVSGLDEAVEAGKRLGVEVIRGVELSVSSECGEIHILGLWLPEDSTAFEHRLKDLRDKRDERNTRIVQRLNDIGLKITLQQVLDESHGETVGRPHIARALLRQGYVSSIQDAFNLYLAKNSIAFVPKEVLTPEDGVRMLADLGATVSIAHPMLLRCSHEWLNDMVATLAGHGLSAIEAYHSEHSFGDERHCAELAARHNLRITGGSDFHGNAKPRITLGRGKGGLRVTLAVLERLKEHRRQCGLPVC